MKVKFTETTEKIFTMYEKEKGVTRDYILKALEQFKEDLYRYGINAVLSRAMALRKGSSEKERLDKALLRLDALVNGQWESTKTFQSKEKVLKDFIQDLEQQGLAPEIIEQLKQKAGL